MSNPRNARRARIELVTRWACESGPKMGADRFLVLTIDEASRSFARFIRELRRLRLTRASRAKRARHAARPNGRGKGR